MANMYDAGGGGRPARKPAKATPKKPRRTPSTQDFRKAESNARRGRRRGY